MNISKESIRLKYRNNVYLPITKNWRRKKLLDSNFTIISNNCWGGTVYESYGIKKLSPTIGMFIMPDDYLKMISNLRYYLEKPIEFIEPDDSKWREALECKNNWKTYLIGKVEDIELQMLHYHDEKIARRKWEERVKRINWDSIIYKFNDQNGATKEQVEQFINMSELTNKLCFVAQEEMKVNDKVILINQPEDKEHGVKASREPYGRSKYLDVTKFINDVITG